MTMQNPLATLQAFSPTAQGVTGQIQAGGNVLTQGLMQDQQRMVNAGLEQQQNVANTVNRLQELERQIGFGATPDQLAGTIQGFHSAVSISRR